MTYWIDLFTGTTWEEFRKAGSKISGFRERMQNTARKVQPGDIFLCYLTGVMRWVGALEVLRGPFEDSRPIWNDADYPVRFEVRPVVQLDPEHGVPMEDLQGRVNFFASAKDKGKFKGFVRKSPNQFNNPEDGILILDLLRQAELKPSPEKSIPKSWPENRCTRPKSAKEKRRCLRW